MKITANDKLAVINAQGQVREVLAEGREAVEQLLEKRATPRYGSEASHRRERTRKYQANAALAYEKPIAKLRKQHDIRTEGMTIRLVLEAGLKALGFQDVVEEVEAARAAGGQETES